MSHNIFALSTPDMTSAICVFRLSGKDVVEIIHDFLKKPLLKQNQIYYRDFFDTDNQIIDKGIVFYKKSPHSFTGEDMVEIQLHGSRAVIRKMTDCFLKHPKLSLAEKGDFSKRAFLNGKMDMMQAEALLDLIHADNDYQRRMALEGLKGDFSEFIENIRQNLFDLITFTNAMIDFADDEVPSSIYEIIEDKLSALLRKVNHFIDHSQLISEAKKGLKVAIMGAPNAGKSSFLNKILGRDAVIVSDIAGTTRDVMEFFLEIDGYPFWFIDTAGLRITRDEIEAEGIKRALKKAEEADLILFLQDPSQTFSPFIEKLPEEKLYIIYTKSDLGHTLPIKYNNYFHINNKDEKFIKNILIFLMQYFKYHFDRQERFLLSQQRYQKHIIEMSLALQKAQKFAKQDDFFLFSEEIRIALASIEEMTCKIGTEEILGNIFSNFCIGK